MKKMFVTALAVALLGAMTLGCGRLVGINVINKVLIPR